MFVQRAEDGVWLEHLPAWVVDTLLHLPEWVESDHPDVRARLLPPAYEDEALDSEWRASLGASLEHLFASRTELVRNDLKRLRVEGPVLDLGPLPAGAGTDTDDDDDDSDDDFGEDFAASADADDDDEEGDVDEDDDEKEAARAWQRLQTTLFTVFIPAAHISAWVSTLQAGTHALFILEGLSAADVNQDPPADMAPEKQMSMLRLSVLQEILVNLLED